MYSPTDVAELVGTGTYARGEDYARRGMVVSVAHKPGGSTIVGQVRGSVGKQYVSVVEMSGAQGGSKPRYGRCSCPVRMNCKHVVATLLAYRTQHTDDDGPGRVLNSVERSGAGTTSSRKGTTAAGGTEWERTFAELLDPPAAPERPARDAQGYDEVRVTPIALQVEIETGRSLRLAMSPAIMGASGRWVRSNISWGDIRFLGYRHGTEVPAEHVEVLQAILGLASARSTYYSPPKTLYADELPGSALWAILADAQGTKLPIIGRDRAQTPVHLTPAPARTQLTVNRSKDGLELHVAIALEEQGAKQVLERGRTILMGRPAAGLFTWMTPGTDDVAPTRESQITLARLTTAPDDTVRSLLDRESVAVPEVDMQRFMLRVLPALRGRVDDVVIDDGIALPEAPRPTLRLIVQRLPEHVTRLSWQWRYLSALDAIEGGAPDDAAEPILTLPLGSTSVDTIRDKQAETEILERVADASPRLRDILDAEPPANTGFDAGRAEPGAEDAGAQELHGLDTARFFTEELAELEAFAEQEPDFGVEVVSSDAEAVDYRFATELEVSVSATELDDSRDWFDLAVTIRAGQQVVPFAEVFKAIATGKDYLLLVDGLHFKLDDERFDRLRELLEEARALQDTMGSGIKVSRYQAGIFEELEQLGFIDTQTDAWRSALGALAGGGTVEPVAPPKGLKADLRPYQQTGFEWLAFLAKNRLGGILADDMGLGKTVQALALIEHTLGTRSGARRRAGTKRRGAPFLIVAPTSVVGNWLAETEHFTPGLRSVAITETRKRRGKPLEAVIGDADADVVVTSYALFRLGFEEFDDVEWSGLILDEAQFIKNHQSVAYQCARRLAAPVKFAMTGTPLENNLMELWSLLSVVSPGLFPHPGRFTEYYGRPIERNGDTERLAQLRSRVAPFMLRRTKEAVATDLPVKQEQVSEIELNSKHRKIYDQYLQRERAKVLGLIEELDEHRFEVFRSLTLLRQASLDVSLVDEKHSEIPSSKLDVLFEMLDSILAEDHSVLIFSQFTQFLGKVRTRLEEAGIEHSYLDGRTRRRTETIERFTSGQTKVFLISLKAGGFGLNLTAADYCILLDPWWNPAAEAQAVDRAHRIGQTRPVNVYRMVSANTIEEKVMELKAGKSALFTSVLEGGPAKGSGITANDVRDLLG